MELKVFKELFVLSLVEFGITRDIKERTSINTLIRDIFSAIGTENINNICISINALKRKIAEYIENSIYSCERMVPCKDGNGKERIVNILGRIKLLPPVSVNELDKTELTTCNNINKLGKWLSIAQTSLNKVASALDLDGNIYNVITYKEFDYSKEIDIKKRIYCDIVDTFGKDIKLIGNQYCTSSGTVYRIYMFQLNDEYIEMRLDTVTKKCYCTAFELNKKILNESYKCGLAYGVSDRCPGHIVNIQPSNYALELSISKDYPYLLDKMICGFMDNGKRSLDNTMTGNIRGFTIKPINPYANYGIGNTLTKLPNGLCSKNIGLIPNNSLIQEEDTIMSDTRKGVKIGYDFSPSCHNSNMLNKDHKFPILKDIVSNKTNVNDINVVFYDDVYRSPEYASITVVTYIENDIANKDSNFNILYHKLSLDNSLEKNHIISYYHSPVEIAPSLLQLFSKISYIALSLKKLERDNKETYENRIAKLKNISVEYIIQVQCSNRWDNEERFSDEYNIVDIERRINECEIIISGKEIIGNHKDSIEKHELLINEDKKEEEEKKAINCESDDDESDIDEEGEIHIPSKQVYDGTTIINMQSIKNIEDNEILDPIQCESPVMKLRSRKNVAITKEIEEETKLESCKKSYEVDENEDIVGKKYITHKGINASEIFNKLKRKKDTVSNDETVGEENIKNEEDNKSCYLHQL